MLISSPLLILTSHFTPLIVSPPFLSSHLPSPSVSPSALSFSSTLQLLVSEMGSSIILLCPRCVFLSLPSPHAGGREDKGRIRRKREAIDKDCWRRSDGWEWIGWMCENHREGKRVKALPSRHLSVCFISWLPLSDRLKEAPSLCLTVSITLQQPD